MQIHKTIVQNPPLPLELKHLLSITTAVLTAPARILYSMGRNNPWFALGLWMAVISSLVVTDFLGIFPLNRNVGSFLMWCALGIFVVRYLVTWDVRIFAGRC